MQAVPSDPQHSRRMPKQAPVDPTRPDDPKK
jgi:hypothetical protein